MNKDSVNWSKWLPIFLSGAAVAISIIALYWNIISEQARSRARLEVKARRIINLSVPFGAGAAFQPDRIGKPLEQGRTAGAATRPSNDDHDEIYLVFRNLSHRPTAVLDIRVKDKGGKDLGGRGYKRQIILPLKIGPWDAEGRDIRIENNDAAQMAYIEIQDIDQNIFCVRPTTEWSYATKAKSCPPENH
jgi:hypothetical protein